MDYLLSSCDKANSDFEFDYPSNIRNKAEIQECPMEIEIYDSIVQFSNLYTIDKEQQKPEMLSESLAETGGLIFSVLENMNSGSSLPSEELEDFEEMDAIKISFEKQDAIRLEKEFEAKGSMENRESGSDSYSLTTFESNRAYDNSMFNVEFPFWMNTNFPPVIMSLIDIPVIQDSWDIQTERMMDQMVQHLFDNDVPNRMEILYQFAYVLEAGATAFDDPIFNIDYNELFR